MMRMRGGKPGQNVGRAMVTSIMFRHVLGIFYCGHADNMGLEH